MSYKVLIIDKANEDIRTAALYYKNIQPDLAKRFIREIRKKKKTFG
jgi:plasmid stabilization system protein ParE